MAWWSRSTKIVIWTWTWKKNEKNASKSNGWKKSRIRKLKPICFVRNKVYASFKSLFIVVIVVENIAAQFCVDGRTIKNLYDGGKCTQLCKQKIKIQPIVKRREMFSEKLKYVLTLFERLSWVCWIIPTIYRKLHKLRRIHFYVLKLKGNEETNNKVCVGNLGAILYSEISEFFVQILWIFCCYKWGLYSNSLYDIKWMRNICIHMYIPKEISLQYYYNNYLKSFSQFYLFV